MKVFYPILVGLLSAPIASVVVTLATYGVFCLFMAENQGRRGLLAGVLGIPVGLFTGFIVGHTVTTWLLFSSYTLWRSLALGLLIAVPAAIIVGGLGLILGTHLAEARGISNYAGERAAWGLFHVALPAAVLIGIAAFLLGRLLAR
ncbi:MAG: hypothetical protein KIS67_19735 [Verrucomicrobiae bacterium]|nr:hypothetical protein [Verrucomicrobiae bacterium]